MAHPVVIFGAERMSQLLRFYLDHDSEHRVAAFTVDGEYIRSKELQGLPLVPFEEVGKRYPPDKFQMLIAVGYRNLNRLRADKFAEAKSKGYSLISYVSSKSTCWETSRLGENCIVLENNLIQPGASVGDNVVLWSFNHVGRDAVIHDHCYVSSHAAINGEVTIGPSCFIGSNTTFRDGVTVGAECIIGAGAVIMRDTREREVYVSEPTALYRLDSNTFLRMSGI